MEEVGQYINNDTSFHKMLLLLGNRSEIFIAFYHIVLKLIYGDSGKLKTFFLGGSVVIYNQQVT